ncbi:DUF5958 family protein [Streptomyces sp. UNOB3_S3]|uniref:DUF5958 family protein n=1 Tax=Streptomyces sp. UNOB3_S3 TaxID=2871682 RepID=UPI001E60817B|nr:DUF5958 family protein [Streptomyces sp. UNOB3_S3]MCC3773326.1 hypothetical protein [Streptomyces sp. UNOB3_S3]
MNERDILLNELAQDLRPMPEGIGWFDGLGPEEQSEVLLFLRHHRVQARTVAENAPENIRRAGLHPFACQGYCFALTRFGTPADAALLTRTSVDAEAVRDVLAGHPLPS